MSDEDPHNSNNRRDKKSKLFRPHEITDGKCSTKRDPQLSDWMVDYPISIILKLFLLMLSTFTHDKECLTHS